MERINETYLKLCDRYVNSSCVSKKDVFERALQDGKITKETYYIAREYYGHSFDYMEDDY